jgi:hypothetical protein
MDFMSFIVIAMIGEAVWETGKMIWQDGKLNFDRIGAMIVGLILSLGTGLDFMATVGISMRVPYLGMIFTGILISRGANFMHDILSSINNVHQKSKIDKATVEVSTQTPSISSIIKKVKSAKKK